MSLFKFRSNKFTKKVNVVEKEHKSDLDVIKQEAKLIQRERYLKELNEDLNELEKNYNPFKSCKTISCVFFGLFVNPWNEYKYELITEQKDGILNIRDTSLFTEEENEYLYSIFGLTSSMIKILLSRNDRYKHKSSTYLNKISIKRYGKERY